MALRFGGKESKTRQALKIETALHRLGEELIAINL